jgi:hypothetical protein
MNKYCYKTRYSKVKGFFNIYQATNGSIQLMMNNCNTTLSLKQIKDLHVPICDFIDFDVTKFKIFYRGDTKNE